MLLLINDLRSSHEYPIFDSVKVHVFGEVVILTLVNVDRLGVQSVTTSCMISRRKRGKDPLEHNNYSNSQSKVKGVFSFNNQISNSKKNKQQQQQQQQNQLTKWVISSLLVQELRELEQIIVNDQRIFLG